MNSRTDAIERTSGLRGFVESLAFQYFVTTVLIVNAITLGLETAPAVVAYAGPLLHVIDSVVLPPQS